MGVDVEAKHIVFKGHKLLLAVEMACESAIAVGVRKCLTKICHGSLAGVDCQVVAKLRVSHGLIAECGIASRRVIGQGGTCFPQNCRYSGKFCRRYRIDNQRPGCFRGFSHLLLFGLFLKLLLQRFLI